MSHQWQSQQQGDRPTPTPQHGHAGPPPMTGRRGFLAWLTHGLGALFGLALAAPIVAYLIDPRHRAAAAGGFKRLARLDELPIGQPAEFAVRETQRDAWVLNPNQVVGRVFLIRRDEDTVEAYTTVCPHLGCSINYTGDANGVAFLCPCHGGQFDIQCRRIEPNPAKRDMDRLPLNVVEENGQKFVEVQYKNFQNNLAEQQERT